jgi:hypothetical protein
LWISRDVIDPGLMSAPVINRRTVALEADVMASVTASATSAKAIFFMWNPPRTGCQWNGSNTSWFFTVEALSTMRPR